MPGSLPRTEGLAVLKTAGCKRRGIVATARRPDCRRLPLRARAAVLPSAARCRAGRRSRKPGRRNRQSSPCPREQRRFRLRRIERGETREQAKNNRRRSRLKGLPAPSENAGRWIAVLSDASPLNKVGQAVGLSIGKVDRRNRLSYLGLGIFILDRESSHSWGDCLTVPPRSQVSAILKATA